MRIAVLHVNANAIAPLNAGIQKMIPDTEIEVFCDEALLRKTKEEGVSEGALRDFARMFFNACDAGVDGILIACTIFSGYAEILQSFTKIPVVAVDIPSIQELARTGGHIGILATTPAGGQASKDKLLHELNKLGKEAEITVSIVPEAMAAMKQGKPQEHDRLLAKRAEKLTEEGCTSLFLSQITTAGAKVLLPENIKKITMTTTEEGILRLRELMKKQKNSDC